MKLVDAQVLMYKNIVDSSMVSLDEHVTALVGKNESGKTSFLPALYGLNPAPKDAVRFNKINDYPRWRIKRDERQTNLEEVAPITARFSLSAEEIAELSDIVETTLPSKMFVRATCNYANTPSFKLEFPGTRM